MTHTFRNRMMLDLAGDAGTVEKTFHVRLERYRKPDATEFYGPDQEPSLDTDIPVLQVAGLDNLRALKRAGNLKSVPLPPKSPGSVKRFHNGGTGPNDAGVHLYAGNDFRNIYAPCTTLTGAGQSIALFEGSPFYPADITAYVSDTGIANPNVVPVSVNGFDTGTGNITNIAEEEEVSKDIEMAAAMAPGLSAIYVYEDGAASATGPVDVLNALASPPSGVPLSYQISNSWTWTLTGGSDAAAVQNAFAEFAAQGQSFFQSAGDYGAYDVTGDVAGQSNAIPEPLIDTSEMTVVGGTSLTTSGTGGGTVGTYVSETSWNNKTEKTANGGKGAGGGGICAALTIPSYQSPFINAQNGASAAFRNLPDVSIVSDELLTVVDDGVESLGAGTSAAAPLWAGFMAMANELSASQGAQPIGFANALLYQIAGGSGAYTNDFHDINDGSTNNDKNGPAGGLYPAVTGYDLSTGIGSPNCALIAALCGDTPTSTPTTTPSPTLSSTGSVTGTPTEFLTATQSMTVTTSPTRTATASASPTASDSPTATASRSQTATVSASPTVSPSSTTSLTPSVSGSPTASATFSSSPSPTLTETSTPTCSPSASASLTPSATDSPSASRTSTETLSATPSPTASRTFTPGTAASASSTAVLAFTAQGPNQILRAVPVPNPNPSELAVLMGGSATVISVRLYSRAFLLVRSVRIEGDFSAGWVRVPLPQGWNQGLARGIYFAVLRPVRDGKDGSGPSPLRLALLR